MYLKIRIGKKWLHLKSVRLHHWLSPLPPGTTLHQIRAKAPVEKKNENIKCARIKLSSFPSCKLWKAIVNPKSRFKVKTLLSCHS